MGVLSTAFIWLFIAIVLAVMELATLGLVTIWFAIGAIVAMIVSLLGASIWMQLICFVVVSGVILVTVRPLAAKYVNSRVKKTNIDALVGRKLIAKTDIDNLAGTGKVDLDGSTWIAVSSSDDIKISAGEEVQVVKITGAKVIVERVAQ